MNHDRRIPILPGEQWWGGCIDDGHRMPFTAGFCRRLLDQLGNQVQPLLISNHGRWIWSEDPFAFSVAIDEITISETSAPLQLGAPGGGLRGACRDAAARFFPAQGKMPHELLFTQPQYNTWIELQYQQTQAGVLAYAERLIAEGYPPGVLMIDDTWQYDYGHWRFPADRFPDPKGMVDRLHALGFLVMLWICPQVSADGRLYLDLRDAGLLLRGADGRPAIRDWWNGYSALVDVANPAAATWLHGELEILQTEFGIDGFKLDAGDFCNYRSDDQGHRPGHPALQSQAWAEFAEGYPLNELRACWKLGNHALAQRLRDKTHSWDTNGIAGCIPNILAQGLVGYAFSCPDMVGGGEYQHFNGSAGSLDGELFVRHAQLAALLPMQQFSAAPWRVLDAKHARLCRDAALLHAEYGTRILALARHAAATGEPIVRPLAWIWDDARAYGVHDQFLLGDDLLVAPVVTKGARTRQVLLPPGKWRDDQNVEHTGGDLIRVDAPLERLPRFTRC